MTLPPLKNTYCPGLVSLYRNTTVLWYPSGGGSVGPGSGVVPPPLLPHVLPILEPKLLYKNHTLNRSKPLNLFVITDFLHWRHPYVQSQCNCSYSECYTSLTPPLLTWPTEWCSNIFSVWFTRLEWDFYGEYHVFIVNGTLCVVVWQADQFSGEPLLNYFLSRKLCNIYFIIFTDIMLLFCCLPSYVGSIVVTY